MAEMRRPLAGLNIIDIVAGPLAPATRYLAELGAYVTHISGDVPELSTRAGLEDLAAHSGKARLTIDAASDEDIAQALSLIGEADALVIDTSHGLGKLSAFAPATLRGAYPDLLIIECSNFGRGNSCSGWQATDAVLHALTGELSRSGIRDRAPLLPPGELATQCAAVQLAYVMLVSLITHLQTGAGDHVDYSMLDGAMQALDPGYGISGSATMGRPARLLSRDRPPRGFQYPIIPCADGYVRICLLAARQWRGMFEWMGRPEEFASPDFEKIGVRYKSTTLIPAISVFFSDKTRADLEAGAQAHGVPLSALLDGLEAVENPHFRERQAFRMHHTPDGTEVMLPNGVLEIDGQRMTAEDGEPTPYSKPIIPAPTVAGLPLSGLKVLDLGIIVVGGEQGRLLADLGADVIKIESRAFPDGTRQSDLAIGMSVSFAAGHRNKRSLGLNLRDPEGKALFERLVAQADVVLTNFKPGTMASLGLGYDQLRTINPGIILVESSAFGAHGPWAKRMGYGPLVRAATGLTEQWRYPDDPESYSDSVTIYPDHVGGRVSILGVLALLIDRARAGKGGHVISSQAEIVLAHQAWQIAASKSGLVDPAGPPDAPWGVFPAQGDDEWCVVTIRDDADWKALCSVVPGLDPSMDRATRVAARVALEAKIASWLAERTADEAMADLQALGIPAARMLRVADLPDFAYFAERGVLRVEEHPYLAEAFHSEAMIARTNALAPPPSRTAPLAGENTVEVMQDWLGLCSQEIADLTTRGVLETPGDDILQAIEEMKEAAHG